MSIIYSYLYIKALHSHKAGIPALKLWCFCQNFHLCIVCLFQKTLFILKQEKRRQNLWGKIKADDWGSFVWETNWNILIEWTPFVFFMLFWEIFSQMNHKSDFLKSPNRFQTFMCSRLHVFQSGLFCSLHIHIRLLGPAGGAAAGGGARWFSRRPPLLGRSCSRRLYLPDDRLNKRWRSRSWAAELSPTCLVSLCFNCSLTHLCQVSQPDPPNTIAAHKMRSAGPEITELCSRINVKHKEEKCFAVNLLIYSSTVTHFMCILTNTV